MATSRHTPAAIPPDWDTVLPVLEEALRDRLLLKLSDLRSFGIPARLRSEALDRLAARGFDRLKTGVRLPLQVQLETLLAREEMLRCPLHKRLKGAGVTESKALEASFARAGRLHLLVRGSAQAVGAPGLDVLSPGEMGRLAQLSKGVQQALKRRTLPRTLVRSDVRELLPELERGAGAETPQNQELLEVLQAEARRRVKPEVGLCFVPELMLALLEKHSLGELQKALLRGSREGRWELPSESGTARLHPTELALCPQGLGGSRLVWLRLRTARL